MTFAQLQALLARYLGLQALADDPVFNAWGPDALNDAHLQIARELQIPRRVDTYVSTPDEIIIPPDIQTWGILTAYNDTDGVPMTVISPARSGMVTGTIPRFIVYDPSILNVRLLPQPTTPINVTTYVAIVPLQLVNDTNEPFNGRYAEFHHVVALKAALDILDGDIGGDDQRVQWLMSRYLDSMRRFERAVDEGKDVRPRSKVVIDDVAGAKT